MGGPTMTRQKIQETLSLYGDQIKNAAAGLERKEWKPLRRWPAVPHPKQEQLDEFRRIPSMYA